MKLLGVLVTVVAVVGCSNDQIVYRPHESPKEAAPESTHSEKLRMPRGALTNVKSAPNIDLATFGVPLYPNAEVDKSLSMSFDVAQNKEIVVAYNSTDSPSKVADFYRERLKPHAAYGAVDLITLEAVTKAGYLVQVAIVDMDPKTTITFTILDKKP